MRMSMAPCLMAMSDPPPQTVRFWYLHTTSMFLTAGSVNMSQLDGLWRRERDGRPHPE